MICKGPSKCLYKLFDFWFRENFFKDKGKWFPLPGGSSFAILGTSSANTTASPLPFTDVKLSKVETKLKKR